MDSELGPAADAVEPLTPGYGGALQFSNIVIQALERTRPWVRFLGILGFVIAAFMIGLGLLGGAGLALDRNPLGVFVFIFYPTLGMLYVTAAVLLTRYANNIGQFLNSRRETDLAAALDAQRGFWKFAGIIGIVAIVITLVSIPLFVILGVAAALGGAR